MAAYSNGLDVHLATWIDLKKQIWVKKSETKDDAMDWIFVAPPSGPHSLPPTNPGPDSYVEMLTLTVMVLGGGALERWLGHEGAGALITRNPESPLCLLSSMWGYV